MREGHPDLDPFKQLFSVDPEKNSNLLAHLGRWVAFKSTARTGTSGMLPHKVMHLQKNYRGEVVFRVENQLNRFGRPASPVEVRFITATEARDMWEGAVELVYGRYEPFDPDFHETPA
jgi:hypothetical protein